MLTELRAHLTPNIFTLGDKRLDQRGRKIMERFSQSDLQKGFPCIFANQCELKGFYRFVNNPKVQVSNLIAGNHCSLRNFFDKQYQSIDNQLDVSNIVPFYQDTTYIDYSNRFHVKLGYTQNKTSRENSALLHTMIACNPEGHPIGIMHQNFFVRDAEVAKENQECEKKKFAARESYKWVRGLKELSTWQQSVQADLRPVVIGDRESDSADVINAHREHSLDFIIRSRFDRIVPGQTTKLIELMRSGENLEKCRQNRRLHSRQSKQYYQAECSIHYGSVSVKGINQPISIVYLKEDVTTRNKAVEGPAAEWFLLTSLTTQTPQQAVQCMDYYAQRWPVTEDFHKALKTGSNIERRQFESKEALANVTALISLQAIRILSMRYLSEQHPDTLISQTEWGQNPKLVELMEKLDAEYLLPRDRDFSTSGSIKRLMQIIARMGGHQGYAQKGRPGWKVLWYGAQKMTAILDALKRYS